MKEISRKCKKTASGIHAEIRLDPEIPSKKLYIYVNFHCGKSECYSVTRKSILGDDEQLIGAIEEYDTLEEAKESRFYSYFEELSDMVEETL